jgi:translation initiation factor eIF-2B subunit delta
LRTTLISDGAMGIVLQEVDACVVGADGVLQDGSLINKTGSYLLALAASQRAVPFYSICETFKYHVGAVPYQPESKSPDELSEPIEGVEILNNYFEPVPARLVTSYITELGVLRPHLVSEQIGRWQHTLAKKNLFGDWK